MASLRAIFLAESCAAVSRPAARRPGARLPEAEARWLFQQLVIGLEYCHSRGVASRNIKPENLLIDNSNSPLPLLKISDFVYSKVSCAAHALHDRFAGAATAQPGIRAPSTFSRQARAARYLSAPAFVRRSCSQN